MDSGKKLENYMYATARNHASPPPQLSSIEKVALTTFQDALLMSVWQMSYKQKGTFLNKEIQIEYRKIQLCQLIGTFF